MHLLVLVLVHLHVHVLLPVAVLDRPRKWIEMGSGTDAAAVMSGRVSPSSERGYEHEHDNEHVYGHD